MGLSLNLGCVPNDRLDFDIDKTQTDLCYQKLGSVDMNNDNVLAKYSDIMNADGEPKTKFMARHEASALYRLFWL